MIDLSATYGFLGVMLMMTLFLMAAPGVGLAQEGPQDRRLSEKVIERIYPDGRRTLVIGDIELQDRTPDPEPAPQDLTEIDHHRGFVLYQRDSDQVFRYSTPKPEQRITGLNTVVSLGEKRHVQFAVHALVDLGQVNITAGPLVHEDGEVLPDVDLNIRPVRLGLWRSYWFKWFREEPKLIDAPGTLTEVTKGQNQQYWITLSASDSAKPGRYHTTVQVQPVDGQRATLTLTVEVLPFRLAEGMWWGIYYYEAFHENTPRDFADIKAHGVNAMLICPPGNLEPILKRQGDKVVASFPLTDKSMAKLKAQGFRSPIAYFPRLLSCRLLRMFDRIDGEKIQDVTYYGAAAAHYRAEDFPEDLKPVLMDLFRQMVRHAQEADWPEILWYLVDEPSGEDSMQMQWAKLEVPLFRQACPGQRMLCTAYSLDTVKAFDPDMEVRVCELWGLDDAYLEDARRHGAEVWGIRWLCQHNNYRFPRHYAGLGLKKMGVQGFTEWTYYGAPPYQPYFQVADKEGCHYAYVDEQGQLLTTITWEAVQEGIDDGRYITTLRRLVEKAQASTQPRHGALAQNGQRVLEQVRRAIPLRTAPPESSPDDPFWADMATEPGMRNVTLSESNLDELRATLAGQITRMIQGGVTLDLK